MLTLLAFAAGLTWAALKIRSRFRLRRKLDLAEADAWRPLAEYMAAHQRRLPESRWASSPQRDRAP